MNPCLEEYDELKTGEIIQAGDLVEYYFGWSGKSLGYHKLQKGEMFESMIGKPKTEKWKVKRERTIVR